MKPRYIVMGLVGLVVGAIVGLGLTAIWFNSFIHSDAFRHEMEARASQTVGGTVEIQEIHFSIFSGVQLSGLATKLVTNDGTIVAKVQSVSCSYSLSELLSRHLQIDGLILLNPNIELTQQPPSYVPIPAAPAAKAGDSSGKTVPLQLTLESAKIKDGHLVIKDSTGVTEADVQNIEVDADTSGYFAGKDVTGNVKIATVGLPDNLNITDLSTSFIYNQNTMVAKSFKASAFSGTVTGDFTLDTSGPSLLTVHAENIDMAQMGQAANPSSPTKLSGSLTTDSTWHNAETGKLTGEGKAQIGEGKLEGEALLNDLAEALKVPAMRDPEIKSITTDFQVANNTTHFSNLVVTSDTFVMTGSGDIDPHGGLSANMSITLNPDTMKMIPGIAATAFTKSPDGSGSIPFHLSGTVSKPQSDFITKLFINGSKVQKSISNTLNKMFK